MSNKHWMRWWVSSSDNPKSEIKNPKWGGTVIIALTLVMCGVVVEAQQPARIPRIGILAPPSASFISARIEAFRQRLRELGYVEGKNIVIEYRYAEGKVERILTSQPIWSVSKLTSSSPPESSLF